mmetsp:Transcript_9235/g.29401  ORF Transcript_9235/g.29401 Transcript_9235/m.29401 type:complete len:277 (+) Transcript_9235:480-1310(+)
MPPSPGRRIGANPVAPPRCPTARVSMGSLPWTQACLAKRTPRSQTPGRQAATTGRLENPAILLALALALARQPPMALRTPRLTKSWNAASMIRPGPSSATKGSSLANDSRSMTPSTPVGSNLASWGSSFTSKRLNGFRTISLPGPMWRSRSTFSSSVTRRAGSRQLAACSPQSPCAASQALPHRSLTPTGRGSRVASASGVSRPRRKKSRETRSRRAVIATETARKSTADRPSSTRASWTRATLSSGNDADVPQRSSSSRNRRSRKRRRMRRRTMS